MSEVVIIDSGREAVQKMDNRSSVSLENEYFHCSCEWHMARLPSVSALLYPLAFRVSGGSEIGLKERRFFASAGSLSDYFDYSECQIRRGLTALEESGFFQLISRKKFLPNHYRVLSHAEWAVKHPGGCTSKIVLPWTGEGDSLGQALWKISFGQVKFADFQVRGLRALEPDEGRILTAFEGYWEHTGAKMKPKNVPRAFYKYLENASHAAQQRNILR